MTKVTTVTIDDQLDHFIDEQVTHGHYASPSEVVDAGLRLLRHQAELEAIRAAIVEGEESGEPQPFDFDAFIEMKRALRDQQ
ncbi:type II toxin-antitoxin system ParD family antitoxin [Rhizobium sp. RAF56]|jgi:antitoxin ParD1/3/4|uniref:type II toxin-antitoxin system ParD family antitoxin n=1 Tax=Rhizobium sp. RAF56 TaxID=3233062 RepID=UPI003F956E0A